MIFGAVASDPAESTYLIPQQSTGSILMKRMATQPLTLGSFVRILNGGDYSNMNTRRLVTMPSGSCSVENPKALQPTAPQT